jgi:hypothetical protein
MPSQSPFLNVFELGVMQSEHPVKTLHKLGNLVLGVLLTAGGLAALMYAAVSGFRGFEISVVTMLEAACLPGIIFFVAFGLGAWCLYSAVKHWSTAYAVFDRGLAVAEGEDARQVPWDEVTHVWQEITKHYTNGIPTGTTHKYTVELADGTKYKIDDKFKDVEALGRSIQSKVTSALFPKYMSALKAGSRLEFGPLAIDYNKLYSGKKELPWDEVKSVRIQNGYVSVQREKGWFRWTNAGVPQIPNFFVLYALLKEFKMVE